MAHYPNFSTDPHVMLAPEIRWYPGEGQFMGTGYAGASDITKIVEVMA